MDKNIYELMNDAEIDLSLYKQETLNGIEKKRIKKSVLNKDKSSNNRFKAVTAAAIVGLCLCTGLFFGNEVYALVKSLQYKLELFVSAGNIDSYIQVLNTSVEDNEILVTLNEIIMDRDELIVTSTVTIEKADEKVEWILLGTELIIDGKIIDLGSSGAMTQPEDNVFEVYTAYNIKGFDIDPEQNHIIDYVFNHITYAEKGHWNEVQGKWQYKFSAEGRQLFADTKTVALDEIIVLPNGEEIRLKEYTSNAIGQKIYFDIINPHIMDYLVELRGTDDKGRAVVFYVSNMNQKGGVFKVEPIDNGYINEDAQRLNLIPYTAEKAKESGRMENDYKALDQEVTIILK